MNKDRDLQIEEEIINCFFSKNKVERAKYLLKKGERIDDLFDFIQDKFIDGKKMKRIDSHYINESTIFLQMGEECHCKTPYIFTESIKSYIPLEHLCAIDMLMFQEAIVYFGNGKAFFQAHEKGGARERYYVQA